MVKLFDTVDLNLNYILKPIIYILIAVLVYTVFQNIVIRIFKKKTLLKKRHHQKKADTIKILILNITKYIIALVTILAIISVFGINVGSILAGLGITAAIVGLAFQDIVKDFLAGISIIAEDQYEIGDTIQIGDFRGEVVFIGLRSTRIRDYKGATKIIANHTITEVINYNLHDSLAIVDVNVSYEDNSERVFETLTELAEHLDGKIPKAKGKMELLGIEELESSGVKYRITVPVDAMEQFAVQRFLRKQIKDTLEKAGIKIPYPQIEVHNGKK